MQQHTRPRKENGCIITSAFSVKTGTYEGDPVLVFADIVAVILRSPADCDEIIKAAALAKQDMPCGYWPVDSEPDYSGRCACGHLATEHGPGPGHPCTQICDCENFRWMPEPEPEQPTSYIALSVPTLPGNTDGTA